MTAPHFERGGFLAQPRHNPTSFALAFAITGGVLAALLLAAPYVRRNPLPDIMEPIAIPGEKPPEADPVKPRADTKTTASRTETRPAIREDRPVGSTDPTATGDAGTILTGRGGAIDIPDPDPLILPPVDAVAEPVIVGARYDSRFVRDQQPPYPAAMQREGIEGSVTVRVRIATDGRVLAVEPLRASDPAFLVATRDWALRKWRFMPATRDGVAIESWRVMSVRFTIDR